MRTVHRSTRKLLIATALGVSLLATGTAFAASVDPAGGTPAAVALAKKVIAASKHVVALDWHEHGGFFECHGTKKTDGHPVVLQAASAPKGCTAAAIVLKLNLDDGNLAAQISENTAKGFKPVEEIVNRAGNYYRYGASGCWKRDGSGIDRDQGLVSFAGETMSLGATHGDITVLRGTEEGYEEVDAINTGTDLETGSFQAQQMTNGHFAETYSTYSYPAKQFDAVTPSSIC